MKNTTFSSNRAGARRRRRGTARLFVLGAAFMASTAVGGKLAPRVYAQGTASAVSQTALRFDIPAGPLADVARAFEAVTGLTVSYTNESIRDLQSPGVSGTFTPQQAVEQMVMNTGVSAMFSTTGVMLDIRTAEFVAVTGRAGETVESPKYVVPLRDIPQTIAVVPRAVIEAQGATTLSEALRNVPGITLQAGEGGGASNTAGDMFNLRGFNAANSLFVDGVRDDGLISRDVFNLEQVEVFMGPTSSDVGRTTAAGYVNMQTKVPHVGSAHSAAIGYGSGDQARLTVDSNWALPPGQSGGWLSKSALRLNVLWQDGGVAGRDEVTHESKAIAPSLALGLDSTTRVTVGAQILRQDNLPDYGIPGAAWPDEPLAPTTVIASAPVDQSNYYGSVGYDYDIASQDTYTGRIEHDFSRTLTLRNQTRYNKTHREAVITTIQNPAAFNPVTNQVTLARQGNDRENTIVSNQTSLVNRFETGSLRHAASLGVEYTFERQYAPALTGLGTRAPVDIFVPNPHDPVTGYAPARSGAFTDGSTDTIAAYAFDTIDLGAKWQASGGLRWEYYDTRFESVDAAGLTTTDLNASDGLMSGKIGLLYRVNAAGNVYASVGTAVTPPGTANFTLSAQPNNVNNPSIEPQTSTNYEVGSKWDFASGRVSLNTAIFRTDNKNVIFTVDATSIPPLYNQDDAQRVNGATVGAMGRITDRWEILANIGYLDSELRSQGAVNNGNRLTLTPEFSGSVWTTYRLPVRLTVGGGIRFTDEVFINAANTIRSPGYHVVDALAEYEVNSHLSLRINIYNLTDAVFIRNVNNNGGRYNPGQPRSAMLTSNVRF
jgi:catecholate siderophore receptor